MLDERKNDVKMNFRIT